MTVDRKAAEARAEFMEKYEDDEEIRVLARDTLALLAELAVAHEKLAEVRKMAKDALVVLDAPLWDGRATLLRVWLDRLLVSADLSGAS